MPGTIHPHIKVTEILYNLEVQTKDGWAILVDQYGVPYEQSHYWIHKTKRFVARMHGVESRLKEVSR